MSVQMFFHFYFLLLENFIHKNNALWSNLSNILSHLIPPLSPTTFLSQLYVLFL